MHRNQVPSSSLTPKSNIQPPGMDKLKKIYTLLHQTYDPTAFPSSNSMDLGPTSNTENPVMVSFRSGEVLDEMLTLRIDPILYLGL